MNCKTAVVLAAGAGTRMRSEKPKVLHEVCGKPMVSHVTSQAAEAGADNIIVVIGHGADRVKNAIDDGKLKFAVQSEQLGTGHAVKQAMGDVPDEGGVFVLCGDTPLITADTLKGFADFDTLFHVLQQIHHAPPVQFVRSCGHIAPWFVQHQIAILFLSGQIHPFTADGNQVCQRSLVPQLDRVTVQLYFSGRDQLFCLPPGTIAGICQQLLNSNFFHFRFFSFFIFCSIRFHQLCCCGAADFF